MQLSHTHRIPIGHVTCAYLHSLRYCADVQQPADQGWRDLWCEPRLHSHFKIATAINQPSNNGIMRHPHKLFNPVWNRYMGLYLFWSSQLYARLGSSTLAKHRNILQTYPQKLLSLRGPETHPWDKLPSSGTSKKHTHMSHINAMDAIQVADEFNAKNVCEYLLDICQGGVILLKPDSTKLPSNVTSEIHSSSLTKE